MDSTVRSVLFGPLCCILGLSALCFILHLVRTSRRDLGGIDDARREPSPLQAWRAGGHREDPSPHRLPCAACARRPSMVRSRVRRRSPHVATWGVPGQEGARRRQRSTAAPVGVSAPCPACLRSIGVLLRPSCCPSGISHAAASGQKRSRPGRWGLGRSCAAMLTAPRGACGDTQSPVGVASAAVFLLRLGMASFGKATVSTMPCV